VAPSPDSQDRGAVPVAHQFVPNLWQPGQRHAEGTGVSASRTALPRLADREVRGPARIYSSLMPDLFGGLSTTTLRHLRAGFVLAIFVAFVVGMLVDSLYAASPIAGGLCAIVAMKAHAEYRRRVPLDTAPRRPGWRF
jgi:hypothetical protein